MPALSQTIQVDSLIFPCKLAFLLVNKLPSKCFYEGDKADCILKGF